MGHPQYCPSDVSRKNIKKAQESNIGRKYPESHRKAMSEAHKNSERALKATRENIKKAHEYNRGRPLSEERKKKISESHKGILKGKSWKVINGKRVWFDRKEE